MFKEEVIKRLEAIQKSNANFPKLKSIAEKYDPGKTGFTCKKGYLLIEPLELQPRKMKVITSDKSQLSLDDFMGVHPYMAIVMESSSEGYSAGDLVYMDVKSVGHTAQDIVVNQAIGTILPESSVLGKVELKTDKTKMS